jgi:tRNA-dihydrouridine synthase
MQSNFWLELKKKKGNDPIIVMAPMANVTDVAFRRIVAKYSRMKDKAGSKRGGPDVMWTEFVSCDGLMLADKKGREKLMRDLLYSEAERPIVAQFFTSKPEMMEKAARLAMALGFDGIDINMGCPDKTIEKQCAGAAMIKNPKLAGEIIQAAKRGATELDAKGNIIRQLPVSVKTRIGYTKNELKTWLPALLKEEPAVITIHARTRKEMSLVPARWEHVKEAVEIRDGSEASDRSLAPGRSEAPTPKSGGTKTLIFGNGDVVDLEDAHRKAKETGADGIMIGRAIFGNPWLFDSSIKKISDIPLKDRLEVMVEHTKLFEKLLGDIKNFSLMKKHYKAYVSGFDGARELRMKLMETCCAKEVEDIIQQELVSQKKP